MKVEGSVAVVTGANRGIGKAFAEELLQGTRLVAVHVGPVDSALEAQFAAEAVSSPR